MSTFLSKLFPGGSSSSSSVNSDLGTMESLCKAINELGTEKSESAGEKAAEIVRKNKELFEKKPNDVEAFLMHCDPSVGSAAMAAAIKGMFDVSAAKNNESGTDRAVEVLHHFLTGNSLVGEHLKLVPEIIFPLLRNIGLYCLDKKDKPEIGQSIIAKALSVIFPIHDFSKMLTSAHSVLFACALKTKDYASVEPFIDVHIDEVANEKCVTDPSSDNEPVAMLSKVLSKKAHLASLSSSNAAQIPFINPKIVLEYLYNGACVLIELKRFEDALLLLDTCIAIPAFSLQEQHIDGYKKYVLLSLLLHGRVGDTLEKQVGAKSIKAKTAEYKVFSEVKFSRKGNTHTKVEEMVINAKDKLKKDGNLELARMVVVEMKKKTILAIVKMFSSVRITDVTDLAHLKTLQACTDLIDQLVAENRITVRVEGDMLFWSEVTPVPSKEDLENKMRIVDDLNLLLMDKNACLKAGSGRLRPSVLFNDDEGLSMPPLEH